jgi:hypothetical protein
LQFNFQLATVATEKGRRGPLRRRAASLFLPDVVQAEPSGVSIRSQPFMVTPGSLIQLQQYDAEIAR